MRKKPTIEFSEQLEMLYPEETIGKSKVGARSVTMQVTDSCNLRCTYCYQIDKHNNFMSLETGKKFIDYLLRDDNPYINTSNSFGIILEFIGGEPLLAIDNIAQFTEYFISEMVRLNHPWLTYFRISICSNGTLYFDPKFQEYLRRYNKFISFSISIDGNKELHDTCRIFPDGSGSYDKAVTAAKHYREHYNRNVSTKMTLSPFNISRTFEAVVNLINEGYTEINLNCVFEEGWTKELAAIYYYQLKKLADYILDNKLYDDIYISRFSPDGGQPMPPSENKNFCGGLGEMMAVNYTGNIYPCLRYMESSLGTDVEPVIIGDLETGIMSNDKYSELVNLMKSQTRRSQSTDECFYCPIASGCSWCSAYCYQYYKKFGKRTTFTCDTHKAEVLANAYYWNRFFLQVDEKEYHICHVPEEWAVEIIPQEEYDMIKKLEADAIEHATSK